jgi:hypothetical protein
MKIVRKRVFQIKKVIASRNIIGPLMNLKIFKHVIDMGGGSGWLVVKLIL